MGPCSSKKYAKGLADIVDATKTDGFNGNTGIQVGCIRWVSKKRIISELGMINSSTLTKIDEFLLKSIPTHARKIIEKDKEIQRLQEEIKKLQNP